jgi:hypothetical protein
MIHRDLCNPVNTKNYSPLRIQFHLLVSRYVCWDGFIPLTRNEMADLLKCDIQSINKFIKKGLREQILSLDGNRLFLLKRVNEYTEGYVKHYPFLESAEFKALSVHAQRFILYTLWTGVHTGRPLKRELSSLYHSGKELTGVLNLYSKAPIYSILEESKMFLKLEIITQNRKEMVRIIGLQESFHAEQALENEGESKLLKDTLEEQCCDSELLTDMSIQDILKIKKYYFQKFHSIGMEVFSHALKKLFSLHKFYELNDRGEIGGYLKAILKDLELKILPTLQKRVEYVKHSISYTKNLWIQTKSQVTTHFQSKLDKLTEILKIIEQKTSSIERDNSFTFYNWLETEQ